MTTPDYRLTQLETLEAESIHVIREVVAELERSGIRRDDISIISNNDSKWFDSDRGEKGRNGRGGLADLGLILIAAGLCRFFAIRSVRGRHRTA